MTFTALLHDLGDGLPQIGEFSHYHREPLLTLHGLSRYLFPSADLNLSLRALYKCR
ncbi:hypothetical protein [Halomonas sp.]|uniref:hypothetical protein n=1 Tax=Halomonas sp. TaxID=1486246 RepID=UPI00298D8FE7|nr:hypothetical protein [Halomonas sp.]MDW7748504.1 hypothetical protein [Halomonas sp.]